MMNFVNSVNINSHSYMGGIFDSFPKKISTILNSNEQYFYMKGSDINIYQLKIQYMYPRHPYHLTNNNININPIKSYEFKRGNLEDYRILFAFPYYLYINHNGCIWKRLVKREKENVNNDNYPRTYETITNVGYGIYKDGSIDCRNSSYCFNKAEWKLLKILKMETETDTDTDTKNEGGNGNIIEIRGLTVFKDEIFYVLSNGKIYYYNLSTDQNYYITNISYYYDNHYSFKCIQYSAKQQKLYLILSRLAGIVEVKSIYTIEIIRNANGSWNGNENNFCIDHHKPKKISFYFPFELLSIVQSYVPLYYFDFRLHFNINIDGKIYRHGNLIDLKIDNENNTANIIYLHTRLNNPYEFHQVVF